MNDLERAITVVLDAERERYVRLLNAYLALLGEMAALRGRVDETPDETNGRAAIPASDPVVTKEAR